MKILKYMTICVMVFTLALSCKSDKKTQPIKDVSEVSNDNVIEVIARDFTFTVDSIIPSGWSTFRMKNTGMMEHFFLLTKMPDTITIEDYGRDVGGAFGVAWQAIMEKKSKEEAFKLLGENLPEWYASAKAMGGSGLISPGEVAINTLKLEPGYYIMECYIKTQNGQFHTELGMVTPIIVNDEISNGSPPEANTNIDLSNSHMVIDGEMTSGKNIVSVTFKEQQAFGLGNDIHVIKVADSTNMSKIVHWMDWSNLDGLVSPGSPAVFVGGTQEMPMGYTTFFECELEPGDYAFIAETPIGRFEKFTVK